MIDKWRFDSRREWWLFSVRPYPKDRTTIASVATTAETQMVYINTQGSIPCCVWASRIAFLKCRHHLQGLQWAMKYWHLTTEDGNKYSDILVPRFTDRRI
ncbi:hypothetical protein TNCV_3841081 [Trichonephila clavipes]|nr:hypothetical protein TNCV_3841081 [Trichonephila clavipes]